MGYGFIFIVDFGRTLLPRGIHVKSFCHGKVVPGTSRILAGALF